MLTLDPSQTAALFSGPSSEGRTPGISFSQMSEQKPGETEQLHTHRTEPGLPRSYFPPVLSRLRYRCSDAIRFRGRVVNGKGKVPGGALLTQRSSKQGAEKTARGARDAVTWVERRLGGT